MKLLAANIIPAIFIHFLFDFETKMVGMSGNELLIAESVRGVLMFFMAIWLAVVIHRGKREVLEQGRFPFARQGSSD